MDRKQKTKKDEFDLLVDKIKKNKKPMNIENNSSNPQSTILAPIVKSSVNLKKIDIDDSNDSTSDDSDTFTDDTSMDTSNSTDEDKKKRDKKKQREKDKRSKKNKLKNKDIEEKDKRKRKNKKKEKVEYKNPIINQPKKLVNPSKIKNNFRNKSRNINNNLVFVDPSTVVFESVVNETPPIVSTNNIIEPTMQEQKIDVMHISDVSENKTNPYDLIISDNIIDKFINIDYSIHTSDKIIIENSINIVDVKDENIDTCIVQMPLDMLNGTFVELINISQYIKKYNIQSSTNVRKSEKIDEGLYQLSAMQNIKFIYHDGEWLSIF